MYQHHDNGTAWSPANPTWSGILWTDAFSSGAPLAHADDDEYFVECDGQKWMLDGVLGSHVDDFIRAGEKFLRLADLEGDYDGSFPTFRDRLLWIFRALSVWIMGVWKQHNFLCR